MIGPTPDITAVAVVRHGVLNRDTLYERVGTGV
jgi:hypothetical protein